MVKLSIFFNIFVLASALYYSNAVPIPTPTQVQPPQTTLNGQSSELRDIPPAETQTSTDPKNGPQRGPPTSSQPQATAVTVATASPRERSPAEKPETSTGQQLAPTVPGSPAPAKSTAPVQGAEATPRAEPPSQKPADKGQQGGAAQPNQALPGTPTPPANTASLQEEGRQQSTQNATANVSAPETRENATSVQRQPQHKGQQGARNQGQQEQKPIVNNGSPVDSSRPQQESSRSRQTPEGQQAEPRTNATAANVSQIGERPHTPGTAKPSSDPSAPEEALAGAANTKQNATAGKEENQQAQVRPAHKGPENISPQKLLPNQTPENQRTQGKAAPTQTAEATAERSTQRANSTSQQTPKEAHPRHPGQQASQALQAAGTPERTRKPTNHSNEAVSESGQLALARNETRPEEPLRAAPTGQHAGIPPSPTTSSLASKETTGPVERLSSVNVTATANALAGHPTGTNHRAQSTGQQAPQEASKAQPAPESKLQAATAQKHVNNSSEAGSGRPLATGQQAESSVNHQRPQQQAVSNQTGGEHASGQAEAQKQSAIGQPRLPTADNAPAAHRQEAPQSIMQHQSGAPSASGRVPNRGASAEESAQVQTSSKPSPNQAAAPMNTRTPSPPATVASASQATHATSKVQQSHQTPSAQQTTSAANPLASSHLAAVLARRPAALTAAQRQQAQRARLQLLLPQQSTAIPTGQQSQPQAPVVAPYYITQPRGSQQSALLLQRLASNPIMRAQANHRRLIEATQNDQFFRMQQVHPELLLANRRRPSAPQSTGQAVPSPARPAANAPSTVPQAASPQTVQQAPQAQRSPAAHNSAAAKPTTVSPATPPVVKQTSPTHATTPPRPTNPTESSPKTPSAVPPTHKVPAAPQAAPGLAPNAYELSRRLPAPAAHSTNVSASPKTQEPTAQQGSHAAKGSTAASTTASQTTASFTEHKPTSTTQSTSVPEKEHTPATTATAAANSQESKASQSQLPPASQDPKHKSSSPPQAIKPATSSVQEGQAATTNQTAKTSGQGQEPQAKPKVEEPTKLGNETSAISSEAKNGAASTSQQSTLTSAVSQERTPAKLAQSPNPAEAKQATSVTEGTPRDKPKNASGAASPLTLEGEDAFGGPSAKTTEKATVTPKA